MQMQRTFIIFICLWGTVLLGQSLNPLQDMDAYLETSSETREIETAANHPPGNDTGLSLLDTYVSSAALPVGKMMSLSLNSCLFLSA